METAPWRISTMNFKISELPDDPKETALQPSMLKPYLVLVYVKMQIFDAILFNKEQGTCIDFTKLFLTSDLS